MASGGVLKRHRFDAKAFDKDQLAEIADGQRWHGKSLNSVSALS